MLKRELRADVEKNAFRDTERSVDQGGEVRAWS